MKRALGICFLICGLVACDKGNNSSSEGSAPDLPPSRASAVGDFADNPLLANVPAETPYAFATFKPIPPEYIRKWSAMIGPMMGKLRTAPGADGEMMRGLAEEIGTFDVKRFEELGFSAKARAVIYGIGVYPVMRVEIADGDRVFAFAQKVATRWQKPLPPPTEQNGHRYWIVDGSKDFSVMLGLTKSELIMALAPRAVLDKNLALVLGDTKPAKALATSQFKDIATRDGFNAQGVGFIDTAKTISAVMDIAGADKPSAPCIAAIDGLAKHAPRITVGYDDFAKAQIAFGIVLELTPDVLADAKSLTTKAAGIDRLMKDHPVMGMAAAVDLSHARALVPKIASVVRDVGGACQIPEAAEAADNLDRKLGKAIPPFLDGPASALFSLKEMKMGAMGPEKIDGYFVAHVKDAKAIVDLASSQLPGMDFAADGKAHALPAMLPFKGHFAASSDAIAVALGGDSSSKVTSILGGKQFTSPLWLMLFDYQHLGELMAMDPTSKADDLEMFKLFGLGVFQAGVDDRGLYTWMSIEMK